MQSILYVAAAMALGALVAVYMPMNSQISKYLGSALAANTLFYGIGLIATVLLLFMFAQVEAMKKVQSLPPHLFITGVLSALMVLGMTYLMPILGARKLFILIVAGQVLMAMMVSHFQLFNGLSDPLTLRKCFGAALVILGIVVSVTG